MKSFKDQYKYNTMLAMTLYDLEMTKQKPNKTFSEFLTRWRGKAAKMTTQLNEKDQVNIILKNLTPVYSNLMLTSPIMNFEQLCDCGMRIEDAINKDFIYRTDIVEEDEGVWSEGLDVEEEFEENRMWIED